MEYFYGYLEKMEKSMVDKLFFIDKIDLSNFDIIVDFGCANGSLIKHLLPIYNNIEFIGYDINKKMIEEAKNNINNKNVKFISDFDELLKITSNKKYAIIFSSVLHEINENEFDNILNIMKNSCAVIIRDMFFDNTKNQYINCEEILKKQKNENVIADFENLYDKIDNLKNLYHYFLKWNYWNNWNTELLENYFGIPYNKIFDILLNNNFDVFYDEQFTLPFKKNEIKEKFDFDLILPTHRKLIFKKKKD